MVKMYNADSDFVPIELQNSELEKIVKNLLDGADLEQVTMKSVCKQVSCQFQLNTLYEYMFSR